MFLSLVKKTALHFLFTVMFHVQGAIRSAKFSKKNDFYFHFTALCCVQVARKQFMIAFFIEHT